MSKLFGSVEILDLRLFLQTPLNTVKRDFTDNLGGELVW